MSGLSEGVRSLPPTSNAVKKTTTYWLGLKVKATSPLSMSREAVLMAELEAIDNFARWVQSELPRQHSAAELERLYADFGQVLSPVWPLDQTNDDSIVTLGSWACEVMDLLESSLNVAVAAESPIILDIAMASLARSAETRGVTLGMVLAPALSAKNIVELARQAPGRLVVPASRVALATSPYELGDQLQSLLSILSSSDKPVVFTGHYRQLQAVFHGGQGGVSDPLLPVVSYVPDIPFDVLARFAVESAARQSGGVSGARVERAYETALDALRPLAETERQRMLPVIAARVTRHDDSEMAVNGESIAAFVNRLIGKQETLAGIHDKPRGRRKPQVHENFVRGLLASDLLVFLSAHLYAQDEALSQLVGRLQTECLTRADHQPIRYCAQGTPGTGKSESAALLARYLKIPHINIDAASQPDYHTASAQLLGSGRGIVGSYEAGRLEKAAKHSVGAIVEVSDLDHAPVAVRSHLADLFLQLLDTGEAQSATGAMFSCANLIFAFTINLPEGRDERLRRSIGFSGTPSGAVLQQNIEAEIKSLFSNAFLSRVGRPILFAPLTGSDLAMIAERELLTSLKRGLRVLGVSVPHITISPETGEKVVASLGSGLISHGARVVAEQTRLLVTQALLTIRSELAECTGSTLDVGFADTTKLALTLHK
ncbi:AAA family ATPase [bacterium]|nr:AAA family ATPase [bacterium]